MKVKNVILSFAKAEQKSAEPLSATLNRLLKSKKKAADFLTVIVQNPRANKEAYRAFCAAFKSPIDRRNWYDLYANVYTNFMNDLFAKATTPEDMLRLIPNLSPWTLEQRFGTIRFGSVPTDFKSEKHLFALIDKINRSAAVTRFKRIKRLECHLPDFRAAFPEVKKIDWFNFDARSDFLRNLFQKNCGQPFVIRQENRAYRVTFLCNPYSSKMVFEIETPEKQSFILKSSPYRFLNTCNDRVRKEHENMAIRADSTYSDALLEFYLKLNNCPHAPDILFYHFNHEVALYRAEKGKPFHTGKNKNKYLDFYSFNTQIIPDSVRLGVYVNDINPGNFRVSDKDGFVKIIDIGHATFANPLTPGVPGMTFTLGNLCGRDYVSINGVLGVEDER